MTSYLLLGRLFHTFVMALISFTGKIIKQCQVKLDQYFISMYLFSGLNHPVGI